MNFLFSKKLNLSEASKRYFDKVEADSLLAERSIEKYKEISGELLKRMGDVYVEKIDKDMITNLKQQLNQVKSGRADELGNLSASRKNQHIVVLKNILKFLEDEGMNVYDPNLIKKFKIPSKPIIYLTKEELEKLIHSISENNISRLRLKTAVICAISCGCRVSELLKLNIDDVDLVSGRAQVIAKGGRIQTLIFNDLAITYIKKYLEMRNDSSPALFATANASIPKRWSVGDFERALRNQGKRAGFSISIHPHLLRRSSASLLFHQNASLSIVQRFLGHATPSVTERYYLGNTSFSEVEKVHKEIMNDFNIGKEVKV